jgi:hypothetical protein
VHVIKTCLHLLVRSTSCEGTIITGSPGYIIFVRLQSTSTSVLLPFNSEIMSERENTKDKDIVQPMVKDEKTPNSVEAGDKQDTTADASQDQISATATATGISDELYTAVDTAGQIFNATAARAVAENVNKHLAEAKASIDTSKAYGGPLASSTAPFTSKIGLGLTRSSGLSNLTADQDAPPNFYVRDDSFDESAASRFGNNTTATFGVSPSDNPAKDTTRNQTFDFNGFTSTSAPPQDINTVPKSNFFGNSSFAFTGQQNTAKSVSTTPLSFKIAPVEPARVVRIAEGEFVE